MTPYTASSSVKTNVHKRRGIVFTDDRKNVSQLPSKPIDQESSSETDDYKYEGPTCYNKPSRVVPHDGLITPDYNSERRFGSVSPTSLSNAVMDIPEYGGLSTPARGIKNPEAINMLQRTINQVESHNKALEKALMWRSYYKSLRYNSSKGNPKEKHDST